MARIRRGLDVRLQAARRTEVARRTIDDGTRGSAAAALARRLLRRRSGSGNVNVASAARRVLAEFREMPEMSLTRRQASRFFGLDENVCGLVLDMLVDAAYLRETVSGRLIASDGRRG
jgi:hypothetical protein